MQMRLYFCLRYLAIILGLIWAGTAQAQQPGSCPCDKAYLERLFSYYPDVQVVIRAEHQGRPRLVYGDLSSIRTFMNQHRIDTISDINAFTTKYLCTSTQANFNRANPDSLKLLGIKIFDLAPSISKLTDYNVILAKYYNKTPYDWHFVIKNPLSPLVPSIVYVLQSNCLVNPVDDLTGYLTADLYTQLHPNR